MGTGPSSPTLAKLATAPPEGARKKAFQIAGRSEALPQKKISEIDVDAIDQWVVDEYRENDDGSPTKYPAVVIGAVSGAAFFRLKRKALGPVYEEFLRDHLAEGGTVITLENTRTWRSTHTGTGASDGRSFFQFGCLGGLPEQEYVSGSQRVREFLAAEGSEYQQWTAPEATGRTPDGEWGFDPALGEDIERLAGQQGWGRRRLFRMSPRTPRLSSPSCTGIGMPGAAARSSVWTARPTPWTPGRLSGIRRQ